jgi:hypothetical protein
MMATHHLSNSSANMREYSGECRRLFGETMTKARAVGEGRRLSAMEICVGIACAAIHIWSLAIIRGRLRAADFDGLFAKDLAETREYLATGRHTGAEARTQ